ncbi:MAG: hypothetical protein WC723_06430 [Candidatus Omnitrophota bacterium]
MEQKTKFILIGLAGGLVVCFFLFMQTLNSKQSVMRQRDDLKKENIALSGKLDKLESGIRDYENKVGLLNKELDRVSREKQDVEKKFELINKEKSELIERLKSRPAQVVVQAPQQPMQPQDTDSYWAGILKAKTDLDLQLGSLRSELKSSQIMNEQLQREKATFDLDINSLRRDNEDLRRQVEYNQKLIDSLTQELVREKNDKIKIQDSFKSLKGDNSVFSRQLKSLNERKVNLERKLQELQEKNASLERKLTEMQTMLTDKISRINDIKENLGGGNGAKAPSEAFQEKKEAVELPPIVVRPQPENLEQASVAALTGKVLAINKDTNFVIVNLGEESGVSVGSSFQVYRGDNPIAVVEVIQVRRDIAACDIKKETTPIRVGDTVR